MEHEVIFVAIITMVVLVAMIIILFVVFQNKKNMYIVSRLETEQKLQQEIAKSQNEILEQGLKNIGWELHDNIGQILSIAKLQLSALEPSLPEKYHQDVSEVNDLITDSLQKIRLLCKTLNPEVIAKIGLVESIQSELERFNKLNFLTATLRVSGDEIRPDQKDEIIVFRILQEFFANVIKHSKANTLQVYLEYSAQQLSIVAQDNGIGFDPDHVVSQGSGLINMKSRAHLIGAAYSLDAGINQGVTLRLQYYFRK